MDSWKHHLFLGVVVELVFLLLMFFWQQWYNTFNLLYAVQICVIIFVSPLICDLDHKQGKLREGITFLGLVIGLIGVIGYYFKLDLQTLMVYGILLSVFAYIPFYLTKHRGFLHTLGFIGLYSIGLYFLLGNIQLAILGFLGAYTHLLGDKIYFKII